MNRVLVTHSCACRPGELLGNESEPEFYTKEARAIEAFHRCVSNGQHYWAVHYRGEHVLVVTIEGRRLGHAGWLDLPSEMVDSL